MAASIGPAQGTKTRPRLRPRTKPPPESACREVPRRAKGRSIHSPMTETISPMANNSSKPMPNQKRKLCGSPSALSTVLPTSSVRLKLTTRPPMMRNGRALLVPVEPPATTTGRTGTMQGERPVMRPPRKATASSSAMRDGCSRAVRVHGCPSGSSSAGRSYPAPTGKNRHPGSGKGAPREADCRP